MLYIYNAIVHEKHNTLSFLDNVFTNTKLLIMVTSVGQRVEYLVEKLYSGTKKEFAEAIGLKNHTYLHKLFKKDNLKTDMLARIANVLGIDPLDILKDNLNTLYEPPAEYNSAQKELEILRKRIIDLERIIKMQDRELADCNSKLTETLQKMKKHA